MLEIAREAALRAGEILMTWFGRGNLAVERKGQADFVTEVDRRAEAAIREFLAREVPDHGLLMEESGASAPDREWQWVVDPLDGTTNYIHRYPFFSVSIGVRRAGRTVVGVVHDPVRGETFTAEAGEPARLNGVPIRTSATAGLEDALLCTGFPFRSRHHLDRYLELFRAVFERCGGIRRDGSAALDLAYVAAGRFDGFFELGLRPWDVAAGGLLVTCAGGALTDFHGGMGAEELGDVVATNGRLQAELVALTRAVFADARPRG